jgi:predicted nucleotidyltransferase
MRRLLATKQRALEYFVSRALQELKGQLVKIFLFGSLARGDFDKASDIDLLVIYSGDKDDFLGKLDEIAFDTAVQHGELLEAIPMSIHEFRARESSSFLLP